MANLDFDNSLAVVMGINQYGNGITPLKTAVSDARAIAKILQKNHGYTAILLTDEQAQLVALQTLIQEKLPAQVSADSRLLLYFAGHGIAQDGDDGPAGYLIPQDATPGKIASYLPMVELHDALTALPCRHFLAIFDCCFAGAFRWSSTRDITFVPEVVHQERYDRFRQDPAWQVITSASYDQKAMDVLSLRDDRGELVGDEHSPFATALLDALQGKADAFPPAKDGNPAGDGVITATELYLYLRDSVEILTVGQRKRQTPELCPLRNHDKGEYIFLTPGHALNLPPAPPLNQDNNPYRGLESFDQDHHDLFFGREKEIEQLLARLETPHPLTVVLGASGTGKSSLVKAGLLPRLAQRSEFWVLPVMRPGNHALEALARSCIDLISADDLPGLAQRLAEDENAFVDIVGHWRRTHPNTKLLFVIDQTEELITQATSPRESFQFQQLVKRVMAEHWECLWIIATLRLDFEAQFQDEALREEWMDARFVISPMGQAQLRAAIELPAAARVLYFEPSSLVDQLVEDVAQTPGALPLLSFTLSELYLRYLARRSNNRALTEADYRALGGVAGSLTQRATQEYETLVAKDNAYAQSVKHVMLRMVALEGGELARRRVPLSELVYADAAENGRVQTVLEKLISARLVVRAQEGMAGEPYVEPAHDALVRGWDQLLRWKREEQEGLALQRLLSPAAKEWNRQVNPKTAKGLLWDDNPRLGLLKETLTSGQSWLNKAESTFVEMSLKRKRMKRSRLVGLLVGFFALLSGGILGLSALNFRLDDAREKAFAEQLAATAGTMTDTDSPRRLTGALLAVYAYQLLDNLGVDSADVNHVLRSSLTIPESKNLIHDAEVVAVSYRPDGQQLATASMDGTARLWDVATRQVLFALSHDAGVTAVSYSPDGQQLATASMDGTARLWDVATGRERASFKVGEVGAEVTSVSFSPDGQQLATASVDATAAIWDVRTREKQRTFDLHEDDVTAVSFSPDGRRLATASFDETARVWDVRTGEDLFELEHEGGVNAVSFHPDGRRLATASTDATARIWDIEREIELQVLRHGDWVGGVSFSPDGRHLATVSDDYMARLWDPHQGRVVERFQHDEPISGVGFSPDSRYLATASDNHMVSVWALMGPSDRDRLAHSDEVIAVSFSPNGQQVATASRDKTARLWDSQRGQSRFTLQHKDIVTGVSFSPDGQQVATASRDKTAKLWDSQSGQARVTLRHDSAVTDVRFSPDGQQVATASRDKMVRLWDSQSGQEKDVLEHDIAINSVAFSPDGQQLLSVGGESSVWVWDTGTGQERFELEAGGKVLAAGFSPDDDWPLIAIAALDSHSPVTLWNWVAQNRFEVPHKTASLFSFSPDGQYLATAGRQGEVKLWNLEDLEAILELSDSDASVEDWQTYSLANPIATLNHEGPVTAVSFSGDGRRIATASVDRTARVWDIATKVSIASVKHRGPVNGVSLSLLGDRIATAGKDHHVWIGWVNSEKLVQQLCQRLGSNLNPEDWVRYIQLNLDEYEPTCPNLPVHPLVDAD